MSDFNAHNSCDQQHNLDKLALCHTLITCHNNADFDAFASMIAASYLYPQSIMIFPSTSDRILHQYYKDLSKTQYNFADIKDINLDIITRLIIVDTKQYARVPHVSELLRKNNLEIIIWDHHPTSKDDIEAKTIYCETIGATATLIIRSLRGKNISISKKDATILGLGIYSDTSSFNYPSTTAEDFEAASWLLKQGMDIVKVCDLIENELTSTHIKALNGLLDSAQTLYINDIPVIIASIAIDGYLGDFSTLAPKLMEMETCDAIFTIASMQGKVIVVARSHNAMINVGHVCSLLNGGGHAYAASATVLNKTIHQVKDLIYQLLYEQVNSDKSANNYMTSPAIGIEENKTIQDANDLILHLNLKAILIFQTGTKICMGILDRQITQRAVSHNLCTLPVSEYMLIDFKCLHASASLQDLTQVIINEKQKLVPIIQDNETVGVISRTDLINIFVKEQKQMPLPKKPKSKDRNISKIMQARLTDDTLQLLKLAGKLADSLSMQIYVVGGFVRDMLLHYFNQDIDLVVEGNGIAFAHILAKELNGRVKEHGKFLTAVVIFEDANKKEKRIDIATARLEYYEYPAALPTVELSSIKMDLYRRDFTINTLAIHINEHNFGHLIDFFGGGKDINDKCIRILHTLSFIEDPTRCLRAIRFKQRYNFKLGQGSKNLIHNAIQLKIMDKLSKPRLFHELNLIFGEVDPIACLCSLDTMGILKSIHPKLILSPNKIAVLQRLKEVLDWYKLLYFKDKADYCYIYCLGLCSNLKYQDAKDILLRFGIQETQCKGMMKLREQVHLVQLKIEKWQNKKDKPSQLYNLLIHISLEGLLYLMGRTNIKYIQKRISRYITKWKFVKIDITGDDLVAMGLKPGPLVGKILKIVLTAKLDGTVTTQESQRILALTLANQLYQDED